MKIYYIGVDGEQTVNSSETLKQIEEIKQFECNLIDHTENDKKLNWNDFYNVDDNRTLFKHILGDREIRVDNKTAMADRPSFCVLTEHENKIIRLEYYEGHDSLSLKYDIRSKELEGKELKNFMDKDENGYNPIEFLQEVFGIPAEISKPILEKAHKEI